MTQERRGPTEAERRAIQRAVDDGDLRRANELLSGVRRRLRKSNNNKHKKRASSAAAEQGASNKSKAGAKNNGGVRLAGTTRFKVCPVCRREFSVNRDGRLRAHKDEARKGKCHGSGAKVAKAWKTTQSSNSLRAVSGGLPGLGKRR